MSPWEKETHLREVVRWMYGENPDIWFTPAAITDENPPYPNDKLKIKDATEVFEELGARGLIRRVYPLVEIEIKGERKTLKIAAWETDKSKTGEIWSFIHGGAISLYVISTFRFLWFKKGKVWLLFISTLVLFATGFFTRMGEAVCDRLFTTQSTNTSPSPSQLPP